MSVARKVPERQRNAARLVELRKRRKYNTRSAMAKAMRQALNGQAIGYQRLGAIERGETDLLFDEAHCLAAFLNYPLTEFCKQPHGEIPISSGQT